MPIQPNQIAEKPLVSVAQPTPPPTGAGKGAWFAKDVGGGQIEGFFADESGVETQVTDNGEVLGGGGGGGGASVSDAVFGAGWNGDTTAAPSKNAVYDKIAALDTTVAGKLDSTLVSQAEAEAGEATTAKAWSAQRVAQAIASQAGGGGGVSDTAYAGSWDGVTATAPSKNAVYDKIETVVASITALSSTVSGKQDELAIPSQAEAEAGVATTERSWSALRVAQAIAALAPEGGGGGTEAVVLRRATTTNANDVQILAFGDPDDVAAITVQKTANNVTLSTIPAGVRLISVQAYFSGTDVGANTNLSITYPDPNGATTLAESILPQIVRYQTNFNPFGTQAGGFGIAGSNITATHSGGVVANNAAALKLIF